MRAVSADIPLPPPERRRWVGPEEASDYDNPARLPILDPFGIPPAAYESVFDFGCGCGRQARQLLLQEPRPRRYVGIDVKPELIDWCAAHLTPVDPAFRFVHHDVYSPFYAPGNSLCLARPFPVPDRSVSLLLGTSIFTHLTKDQAQYYLRELARVMRPDGVAFTTWLFFDRASFPFLSGVHCLYTSEIDFGQAVLFDREWFLARVQSLGLAVRRTIPPPIPGHQWKVFLGPRTAGIVDDFPLGAQGAEWVSGATVKPMAAPASAGDARHVRTAAIEMPPGPPQPPALYGALARLDEIDRSWAWALGRAVTAPARIARRLLGR
jgi:SAM-dependent methyltransferase